MDAIAGYREASERTDIDAMMATLGDNAELVSPISGRMVFRGHADLRILLAAIYGSLSDLRWTRDYTAADGGHVIIGSCRVGPLRLDDAMAFELNADGSIHRIRPHLRPWLSTTVLALVLAGRLAGHPDLILRALAPRRGAPRT